MLRRMTPRKGRMSKATSPLIEIQECIQELNDSVAHIRKNEIESSKNHNDRDDSCVQYLKIDGE